MIFEDTIEENRGLASALRVSQAETRLTVYCLLPYGTSAELVAGQFSQRPQLFWAIGD